MLETNETDLHATGKGQLVVAARLGKVLRLPNESYNYKCEIVGCIPEYPFLNSRCRADARLTVNLYKDSSESMGYMIKGVGLLVEVNIRHVKDGPYISDVQH